MSRPSSANAWASTMGWCGCVSVSKQWMTSSPIWNKRSLKRQNRHADLRIRCSSRWMADLDDAIRLDEAQQGQGTTDRPSRALGHSSGAHCVLHSVAAQLVGDIGTNLAIRALDSPFHPGKRPYVDRGPHAGTTMAA